MTKDQQRAEIAFKALSELDSALDPDRPKPVAVLRRIVREAKQEIDKVTFPGPLALDEARKG